MKRCQPDEGLAVLLGVLAGACIVGATAMLINKQNEKQEKPKPVKRINRVRLLTSKG